MKLKELKTIDIQGKHWRDKKNGNSYFSTDITLNFNQPSEKRLKHSFAYGYGDQYEFSSLELIKEMFPRSKWFKSNWNFNKWNLFEAYGIVVNSSLKRNCFRRELHK